MLRCCGSGQAVWKATRRRVIDQRSAPQKVSYQFLERQAFWFLALGFACLSVTHIATLQHLLSILNQRGLSGGMAVLAASFIGPMQVAGRLAMMASEKYTSHHGVTIAAFVMLGLSVLLLLVSGASPVFLSGFIILFGGAAGTISLLRPLRAREVLGEQNFGAKSGALALPFLLGSAMAPYLGSVIWAIGGYDLLLMLLAVLCGIGCLLYLLANHFSKGGKS